MARATSVLAYKHLLATGGLGEKQIQIFETVMNNGPMTANECYEAIKNTTGVALRHDSNTRARFTELRDMGVFIELGKRTCRITKRVVILWDINPIPPASMTPAVRKGRLRSGYMKALKRAANILRGSSNLADAGAALSAEIVSYVYTGKMK